MVFFSLIFNPLFIFVFIVVYLKWIAHVDVEFYVILSAYVDMMPVLKCISQFKSLKKTTNGYMASIYDFDSFNNNHHLCNAFEHLSFTNYFRPDPQISKESIVQRKSD